MTDVIALIDGIAGLAIVLALLSERMVVLPKWHRFWIAIIACGLLAQMAIEYGGIDRVQLPLWALKDLGIWGLLCHYAFQHLVKRKLT